MNKFIIHAIIAFVTTMTAFSASAQKGYRGFAEVNLGYSAFIGSNDYGFAGRITTVHGYQSKHSFFGIGLGISEITESSIKHKFSIPVFGQYRYDYSLVSEHSFYGKAIVGYSFLRYGIYSGFGIGIRHALNSGNLTAINMGVNMMIETVDRQSRYYSGNNTILVPVLTFGIEF